MRELKKKNNFNELKYANLSHTSSDNIFQGTLVHRALQSSHKLKCIFQNVYLYKAILQKN